MAKHKLFGNRSEPRCETCAGGRPSPDGKTVLCEQGGVMPLDHHCRRYTYDPLRRKPRRLAAPEAPAAAAFSLDDAVAEASAPDAYHTRMMGELRTYLDETAEPDVETILSILHANNNDDTAALLEEAARIAVGSSVPVDPDTEDRFIADDSDDIYGDLERLAAPPRGSAKAALHEAGLHWSAAPEEAETELPLDEDSLVLIASDVAEEEPPLSPEDLVLLADPTVKVEPAYDAAVPVPDDALSLLADDDIDPEYEDILPIPDEAFSLLDEDDDDE